MDRLRDFKSDRALPYIQELALRPRSNTVFTHLWDRFSRAERNGHFVSRGGFSGTNCSLRARIPRNRLRCAVSYLCENLRRYPFGKPTARHTEITKTRKDLQCPSSPVCNCPEDGYGKSAIIRKSCTICSALFVTIPSSWKLATRTNSGKPCTRSATRSQSCSEPSSFLFLCRIRGKGNARLLAKLRNSL